MSDLAAGPTELPALKLLELEQSEFEHFLHDELGQSLVAIRSMAAALDDDASNEIAQLISQAADDAYIEVYDRMMELRAESLAFEADLTAALHQCIDDARLETRNLTSRLVLDTAIEQVTDPVCRRLLLRSLRCIALLVKRLAQSGGELVIDIRHSGNQLEVSFRGLPGTLPEACCDHPRIRRLENRIGAFGGKVSQAEGILQLRLPGRPVKKT